jgi:hypothetical protein
LSAFAPAAVPRAAAAARTPAGRATRPRTAGLAGDDRVQQPGRAQAGGGLRGEHESQRQLAERRDQHQLAAVDGVGDRPAVQPEDDERQQPGDADQPTAAEDCVSA